MSDPKSGRLGVMPSRSAGILFPKFKILKIEIRNFVRGGDFIDFNNGISIEMVKVNFLACMPSATFVEIGGVSVLASRIVLVLSPDPLDTSIPGRQASGWIRYYLLNTPADNECPEYSVALPILVASVCRKRWVKES